MVDFVYLSNGLNALARAHQMSSMAGHLGAAVVAAYFVGEQRPDLDPEVAEGIEGEIQKIIQGGAVFGKKMRKNSPLSDAALFAEFPKEKPDESLIERIAVALRKNIDQPRQSGHNVIFGSIALRALQAHPEFATPSVVEGINKLMALFDGEHPGSGFYGKEKGRIYGHKIKLPDDDGTPEYSDIEGMAVAVFDEVIRQKPGVHRQGYGGLVHIINHAAAIADLAQLGYPDLIKPAVASHRQHLRLWRNLPNLVDELGPVPVSKNTPHRAAYWTSGDVPYDRALLTHRVKTMFGFDCLAGSVEEEKREAEAYQKLTYLM